MSADAFLRAIRAAPDDDLPRLVFADYLDETGDPARAEFIRVQCELATLPDHDPRRRALEDREHDLLSEHEGEWLGDGAEALQEWEWRRGFVSEIAVSLLRLFDGQVEPVTEHPITDFHAVPYADHDPIDDSFLRDLLRVRDADWTSQRWMRHLRRMDLSAWNGLVSDFALHEVFAQVRDWDLREQPAVELPYVLQGLPGRVNVRSIAFGGWQQHSSGAVLQTGYSLPDGTLVESLVGMPLETLLIPGAGFHSSGLHDLLSAPFACTLRHLDISENPIAPDAYRAFEQAHRSMRLEQLDVSGTPLAGISLEPLLHARSLESLTRLEMNGCGSARRNMEVLAGSPFWAQADHLRAHSGTIPASTIEPLCGSAGPPSLRLLDLADNYLRTSGVRLLCESAWAGSLTWLALSANYLDDESCRVLARSGRFAHLWTLHLAHNNVRLDRGEGEQITDAGAAELANEPSLANLRLLSLSNTGITHRGVNAVLNGLYWRLFGLGLAGNDLSPEVVRILAGSPRLARFVWLDLADNPRLRGHALMPLAESPYLSRLCELDCGGIDLADDVRTAFRERLGPRFSH